MQAGLLAMGAGPEEERRMIRPVLLGAAFAVSAAAGYLARSEVERYRRKGCGATFGDRIASAPGSPAAARAKAWARLATGQILGAAEPDDTPESITVRFSSPHGGALYAQMKRGMAQPELTFLSPMEGCGAHRWALTRLDVPDDLGGIGGAA
jgi:hypothetical protein